MALPLLQCLLVLFSVLDSGVAVNLLSLSCETLALHNSVVDIPDDGLLLCLDGLLECLFCLLLLLLLLLLGLSLLGTRFLDLFLLLLLLLTLLLPLFTLILIFLLLSESLCFLFLSRPLLRSLLLSRRLRALNDAVEVVPVDLLQPVP